MSAKNQHFWKEYITCKANTSEVSNARHVGFEEVSAPGLAAALQRRQGIEGFLDIHTSTGLALTHVIGPVTPLNRSKPGSSSMQRHPRPTMNACEMVSVETGQGIAVGLDVARDLQSDHAYMQV